jgi:hypothetical protein
MRGTVKVPRTRTAWSRRRGLNGHCTTVQLKKSKKKNEPAKDLRFWLEGCCCEGEGANLGRGEEKVQKHKKFGYGPFFVWPS